MAAQTVITFELRCNVCDSVLVSQSQIWYESPSIIYVEPCQKCTQKPEPKKLCACGEPFPKSGYCRFCGESKE